MAVYFSFSCCSSQYKLKIVSWFMHGSVAQIANWYNIDCFVTSRSCLFFFSPLTTGCQDPDITFRSMLLEFTPSASAHLMCAITSNQTWWSSTNPCGPFTRSTVCPDGASTCDVTLESVGGEFYHCCTSGEQVEAQARGADNCNYIRSESY